MVERLYPGVYVTEIPFQAKPIEGVPTSTANSPPLHAAAHKAQLPVEHAPSWTQHNDSDPGVTLVQLFAWLSESTLFAARPNPLGRNAQTQADSGVAQGLAVEPSGAGDLHVSPGSALTPVGRPIETESATAAHRVKKP